MRILFVCENYLPHYGGAEVVFKNLAEGFVKRGHQITLLTHRLKGTSKEEVLGGVKVKRIDSLFSRYVFTFFAVLPALWLARKHDLIQTTTFNGAFPAWLAGKLTRKPVVLTVHEVWVGKWKEVAGFTGIKEKTHDLLERLLYFLPFDRYVCVSEATRRDLLRRKVRTENVETIPNGLDYEFWDPKKINEKQRREIRKKLGLGDNFVYFSWGRPGESKGFEYVIRAAQIVREKLPGSQLLLMFGSAEKYQKKHQQLLELIKELGLEEYVKVIHSLPYEELRALISAVDCVVVPSTSEGFGYNAVEANVLGTPLVASDAGSLPEVVSGKHLFFESKNPPKLAEQVLNTANGKYDTTPLKIFSWEGSIGKYLETYSRLLERKKRR